MKYTNYTQEEILKNVKVGDLLKIEYFSPRENKNVTRLFEVTLTLDNNRIIQMESSRMYFVTQNCNFVEEEYNPEIKAWVKSEDLNSITINLINKDNIGYSR